MNTHGIPVPDDDPADATTLRVDHFLPHPPAKVWRGLFFGLGGYAMAMHLKLADAGPGAVPDFMLLYGS
ncbi:hypothetical protein ACFCXR_35570, partial [Streptomyces noursei]